MPNKTPEPTGVGRCLLFASDFLVIKSPVHGGSSGTVLRHFFGCDFDRSELLSPRGRQVVSDFDCTFESPAIYGGFPFPGAPVLHDECRRTSRMQRTGGSLGS